MSNLAKRQPVQPGASQKQPIKLKQQARRSPDSHLAEALKGTTATETSSGANKLPCLLLQGFPSTLSEPAVEKWSQTLSHKLSDPQTPLSDIHAVVLYLKELCSRDQVIESVQRITRKATLEYNRRVCEGAQRVVGANPKPQITGGLRNKLMQQIERIETSGLRSNSEIGSSGSKVSGGEMHSVKADSLVSASMSKSSNIHRSCCPKPHPTPQIGDSAVSNLSKVEPKPIKLLRQQSRENKKPASPATQGSKALDDSLFFRSESSRAEMPPTANSAVGSLNTISYLSQEVADGTMFISIQNKIKTPVSDQEKKRNSRSSSRERKEKPAGEFEIQEETGQNHFQQSSPLNAVKQPHLLESRPHLLNSDEVEEILTEDEYGQLGCEQAESIVKGGWHEGMEVGIAADGEIEDINSFLKHEVALQIPDGKQAEADFELTGEDTAQSLVRASLLPSVVKLEEAFHTGIRNNVATSNREAVPQRQTKAHVLILRYSLASCETEPTAVPGRDFVPSATTRAKPHQTASLGLPSPVCPPSPWIHSEPTAVSWLQPSSLSHSNLQLFSFQIVACPSLPTRQFTHLVTLSDLCWLWPPRFKSPSSVCPNLPSRCSSSFRSLMCKKLLPVQVKSPRSVPVSILFPHRVPHNRFIGTHSDLLLDLSMPIWTQWTQLPQSQPDILSVFLFQGPPL